jgi:trk system potassium uptake protein
MGYAEIFRVLGRWLRYLTYLLCIPLVMSCIFEYVIPEQHPQPHSTLAFLKTLVATFLLSQCFLFLGRKASGTFNRKESILMVVLIWIFSALIGALPFWISHTLQNPLDAVFESVSALTTTGSSVFYPKMYDPHTGLEIPVTLKNAYDCTKSYTFYGTVAPILDPASGRVLLSGIEAVGKSILFWRSFLQWIGGMGIIVLFLAVLPALAMGGKFLFETEIPGPNKEPITPRIKETAGFLWKVYLGLTFLQIVLLVSTNSNMPLFDAVCLSFSTLSTGGFSIRNDGIASYNSFSTDLIIMIFMVLGSLNFSFYFHIIKGKIYRLYEPEMKTFFLSLIFFSLLFSLLLFHTPKVLMNGPEGIFNLGSALRYGFFQTISAHTSTGFAIGNFDLWPQATQVLIIILMYLGGMAGSTSGGIKIARYCILFKILYHKIETIFRPECVRVLKLGKREISNPTAMTTLIFFALILLLSVGGTFFLVLDDLDPKTAVGIVSCMINNAGLAFGYAGPTESCAFLSPFSKSISILWMLLGRLELFVFFVLLIPAFWRKQ